MEAVFTALAGVFVLSVGIEGYLFDKVSVLLRVFLIGSGVVMVIPGFLTDSIGIAIAVLILFINWRKSRTNFLKQVSPDGGTAIPFIAL